MTAKYWIVRDVFSSSDDDDNDDDDVNNETQRPLAPLDLSQLLGRGEESCDDRKTSGDSDWGDDEKGQGSSSEATRARNAIGSCHCENESGNEDNDNIASDEHLETEKQGGRYGEDTAKGNTQRSPQSILQDETGAPPSDRGAAQSTSDESKIPFDRQNSSDSDDRKLDGGEEEAEELTGTQEQKAPGDADDLETHDQAYRSSDRNPASRAAAFSEVCCGTSKKRLIVSSDLASNKHHKAAKKRKDGNYKQEKIDEDGRSERHDDTGRPSRKRASIASYSDTRRYSRPAEEDNKQAARTDEATPLATRTLSSRQPAASKVPRGKTLRQRQLEPQLQEPTSGSTATTKHPELETPVGSLKSAVKPDKSQDQQEAGDHRSGHDEDSFEASVERFRHLAPGFDRWMRLATADPPVLPKSNKGARGSDVLVWMKDEGLLFE
jgi:hypothetical protein